MKFNPRRSDSDAPENLLSLSLTPLSAPPLLRSFLQHSLHTTLLFDEQAMRTHTSSVDIEDLEARRRPFCAGRRLEIGEFSYLSRFAGIRNIEFRPDRLFFIQNSQTNTIRPPEETSEKRRIRTISNASVFSAHQDDELQEQEMGGLLLELQKENPVLPGEDSEVNTYRKCLESLGYWSNESVSC